MFYLKNEIITDNTTRKDIYLLQKLGTVSRSKRKQLMEVIVFVQVCSMFHLTHCQWRKGHHINTIQYNRFYNNINKRIHKRAW